MEEREDSEQISSPTNLASPAPLLTPATRLPLSSKITNYVSFSKTRLVFIVLLAFWIISAAIVIPLWLSIVTVSTTKQLVFFLLHIYLPTGLFIVSGLYLIKAYLNYFQCTLDLCELELSSTVSQIQSKATATKPDERMQKRLGEMIRKFRDDRVKPDAFRLIKFLAKQKIITIPQASPANVVKAVGWLKTRVCKISAVSREKSSKADIEFLKATYSLVRRLPSLTGIVIQGFMVLVLIGSGIAIPTTSTLYATQNRYLK